MPPHTSQRSGVKSPENSPGSSSSPLMLLNHDKAQLWQGEGWRVTVSPASLGPAVTEPSRERLVLSTIATSVSEQADAPFY